MGTILLPGGQRLHGVHDSARCRGTRCCLHRPSQHHMRGWAMYWRQDRRIMERLCAHGIGHPDPDDLSSDRVHGCDGCCAAPKP